MKSFLRASLLLSISMVAVACSKPKDGGPAASATRSDTDAKRITLETKLRAMTNAERARYVQTHADEIRSAYGGPTPNAPR